MTAKTATKRKPKQTVQQRAALRKTAADKRKREMEAATILKAGRQQNERT